MCFIEVESFVVSASSPSNFGINKALQPPTPNHLMANNQRHSETYLQQSSAAVAEDPVEKNEIVVSAEIDLPVPAEIAYDAFSDMSRQTTWSPWLQSVEYIDDSRNETEWKMKFLGVSASWVSISTYNRRPNTISWTSVKGLPNRGRVDFVTNNDDDGFEVTSMKMTMRFRVPSLFARMFPQNGVASRIVQKRMLHPTLENFRQEIMENDMKTDTGRTIPTAEVSSMPSPVI